MVEPSVASLCRDLAAGHAADHRVDLRVGGCSIAVLSNSDELIAELQRYYRFCSTETASPDITVTALEADVPRLQLAFADWPREPGKDRRKEQYAQVDGGRVVHKVRTGMQFVFGDSARLAIGPCNANPNQVINFVNAQYMTWLLDRGWLLCHAAGLSDGARGLAIAGLSGGGKSTLMLHLLQPGRAYVSNDRVLVHATEAGVEMSGVPKLPRINPGTALNHPRLRQILPEARRAALAAIPESELWDLEEKYDVIIDEVFDDVAFRVDSPLSALVILNWDRGSTEPTRFEPADLQVRPDLLGAVVKSPGPFHLPTTDIEVDAAAYLAELGTVPVWEVRGGVDFAAASRQCNSLLAGATPA